MDKVSDKIMEGYWDKVWQKIRKEFFCQWREAQDGKEEQHKWKKGQHKKESGMPGMDGQGAVLYMSAEFKQYLYGFLCLNLFYNIFHD